MGGDGGGEGGGRGFFGGAPLCRIWTEGRIPPPPSQPGSRGFSTSTVARPPVGRGRAGISVLLAFATCEASIDDCASKDERFAPPEASRASSLAGKFRGVADDSSAALSTVRLWTVPVRLSFSGFLASNEGSSSSPRRSFARTRGDEERGESVLDGLPVVSVSLEPGLAPEELASKDSVAARGGAVRFALFICFKMGGARRSPPPPSQPGSNPWSPA